MSFFYILREKVLHHRAELLNPQVLANLSFPLPKRPFPLLIIVESFPEMEIPILNVRCQCTKVATQILEQRQSPLSRVTEPASGNSGGNVEEGNSVLAGEVLLKKRVRLIQTDESRRR